MPLIEDPQDLSASQQQLLRLVAEGVTASKELAQLTDIKPSTIDTYLGNAAVALGVTGRKAAAKRFAELEEKSKFESKFGRIGFVPSLVFAIRKASGQAGRRVWRFFFGLPLGGTEHEFGWYRILLEMFRVAIVGIVGLSLIVLLVLGFIQTFDI